MADTDQKTTDRLEEPDPRFKQFPIPNTADAVVERIVEFVQISVGDAGGPAYEFQKNGAEAAFLKHWGKHVQKHLKYNKYGENPWPHEWKNVVAVAKQHGAFAVQLSKDDNERPVSIENFVKAGYKASGYCMARFGPSLLGCWCNDC